MIQRGIEGGGAFQIGEMAGAFEFDIVADGM